MYYKKVHILIVDDEQPVCDLLNENLTSQDYQCMTVSNGKDALAAIAKQQFDIALLDIRLPGISGMDILQNIEKEHWDIAVIMITAVDDIDTVVKAMKLGAADYIVKPFSLDRIDKCLHNILNDELSKPKTQWSDTPNPNNRNYQGDLCCLEQIDAIARGVEARVDLTDRHSEVVIEKTIQVARDLGISCKEISRWLKRQEQLISNKEIYFKSLLDSLDKSPLLQIAMGVTKPYGYKIQNGKHKN